MSRFFKVVGHRGMRSLYPENTIISFMAAIEAGVDALEFDVHPTLDRKLVITHDDTIERCSNGTGAVHNLTFEQIRALDFGSWKGSEFIGTRIPTLEETLDAICNSSPSVEILIELKENDEACALAVLDELRRRNLFDRTIVLSFWANLIKMLHFAEPRLRVQGFPMEVFSQKESDAYEWLHRLCIWFKQITPAKVKAFHDLGIEVDVCPVDTEAQLDAITNCDVDTITTNAPDLIMPLLRQKGLRPPELPKHYTAWRLHGAGMKQLRCEELPLPEPKPKEILVRIDAVGLCFSDVKIIRLGATHPKLWWNNLDERPLVPGHEAVMTVVKTGSEIPLKYAPGQRFLIQCDIYINGRSCAYGYGMDGAYASYGLIDSRVWQGEQQSYLLDFPDNLSAVATALIEPWSCVRGSYRIQHRATPHPRGKILIAGMPGSQQIYQAGSLLKASHPQKVSTWNLSPDAVQELESELETPIEILIDLPDNELFDDVFCCNLTNPTVVEKVATLVSRGGIVTFLGQTPTERCKIDVGSLHYQNRYYQGIIEGDLSSAYLLERRTGIKPGGNVWFLGGAGAMGQMHVELAISSASAPTKVLVTDLDPERLDQLEKRLKSKAKTCGIFLKFLNPSQLSEQDFREQLHNFAPEGFDDVVCLAPRAENVTQVTEYLNKGALVNLFAGIPAGETALLPIHDIVEHAVRFTGSSGSTFDDMVDTLQSATAGEFKPQFALAAIGGMNALQEGLEAVANGRFPGKIAILPGCPNLPLTALGDLGTLDSRLPGTLDTDGCYTKETEKMLEEIWGEANEPA